MDRGPDRLGHFVKLVVGSKIGLDEDHRNLVDHQQGNCIERCGIEHYKNDLDYSEDHVAQVVDTPEEASFKYVEILGEPDYDLANGSDVEECIDWCIHNFLHDNRVEAAAEFFVGLDQDEDLDCDGYRRERCQEDDMLNILPVASVLLLAILASPLVLDPLV